jgi:hypothetical protein
VEHATFRSWRPHCVEGRAESYGHKKNTAHIKQVAATRVDYMHSDQEKEDEKGVPILVIQDSHTKIIFAKVMPN